MAEEQNGKIWNEYLEDRLEARLLQESNKMEERLCQERMLILNLVERKIKRATIFGKGISSAIGKEATEDEQEQRKAWKWLDRQLEGGVKEKDWDLEVESRNLRNGERNGMWQKVIEEIQQVMGMQEQEECRRRKSKARGKKITVKEYVVEIPEQKDGEIMDNDGEDTDGINGKWRVVESKEDVSPMMEENWDGMQEKKKNMVVMRSEASRAWMDTKQQGMDEMVKEKEQQSGAKGHDIVTWMEDTKKAILELIGIRWKDRGDMMAHSLTGPLLTAEDIKRNREELKLLAMSKPKLHTDFSIFTNA